MPDLSENAFMECDDRQTGRRKISDNYAMKRDLYEKVKITGQSSDVL